MAYPVSSLQIDPVELYPVRHHIPYFSFQLLLWAVVCLGFVQNAAGQETPTVSISPPALATGSDGHLFEIEGDPDTAENVLGGGWVLTRTGDDEAEQDVNVTVSEAGSDFVAEADEGAQVVTFAEGETTATFWPITDDTTKEDNGTVTVALATGTGYQVDGTNNSATVAVRDDDERMEFTIAPLDLTVVEGGDAEFDAVLRTTDTDTFTEIGDVARVLRGRRGFAPGQTRSFSLTWVTVPVEAASPGDFAAVSQQFTISASDFVADGDGYTASRAVGVIATVADTEVEDPERTIVRLGYAGEAEREIAIPAMRANIPDLVDDDNNVVQLDGDDFIAAVLTITDDTTAPSFSSATVDGSTLVLTFDEALAAAPNLANNAFEVKATPAGGSQEAVDLSGSPAISGATVTLTLAAAVAHGDTVTVSYTAPATGTGNKLQDAAGNEVDSFSDQAVTNETADTTAPSLSSATVDGSTLLLTFDEALAAAPNLANNAFEVKATPAGGSQEAVDLSGSPAISGATVTLTLAAAVAHGDTVTVSYTAPATGTGNKLQDAAGNEVDSFSDQAVTNDTPLGERCDGSEGEMRLMGGSDEKEGRVEICADEDAGDNTPASWGTVCDDYWTDRDADVACMALGYERSEPYAGRFRRSRFGAGPGPIWLDDLLCNGNESSLLDCPLASARTARDAIGVHNCRSSEVVGVRCMAAGDVAQPYANGRVDITGTGTDGHYEPGDRIRVTLTFTDAVTVDTAGGTPSLGLVLVDHDSSLNRTASYAAGSGTEQIVFDYRVGSADGEFDELQVVRHSLAMNGGTMQNSGGVDVLLANPYASVSAENNPHAAALSVMDATAEEGAPLEFRVTLSRATDRRVTVSYRTGDGTAKAGEDYTAANGTLSFAPGETVKTVSVDTLEDSHDDDGETFTLQLTSYSGAYLQDSEATGTIHNSDPLPKAWLTRFGRTSASHVVDMLGARFDDAALGDNRLTLGGQALSLGTNREPDTGLQEQVADLSQLPPSQTRQATPLERALWTLLTSNGGQVDTRRFISQSSFDLSLSSMQRSNNPSFLRKQEPSNTTSRPAGDPVSHWIPGQARYDGQSGDPVSHWIPGQARYDGQGGYSPGRWSLWGRGALTRFGGVDDSVNISGDVLTGLLGVDYARNRWLAGVALAYHDGDGSYRSARNGDAGRLESTLVSVNPYLRYALTDRLSVWGTLGYGSGTLQLRQEARESGTGLNSVPGGPGDVSIETDIQMRMGAAGLRGVVYAGAATELALKSDVLWVRTSSDATQGMQAVENADTSRIRLLLSGRHQRVFANDALLTPTLELGLRYDDGAAETGFGMEIGGGVQYADPAWGLVVETRARALLAHEDGSYREWGVAGSVHLDPGSVGRGLSLRLDSAWGPAGSGAEALWQRQTTAGIAQQHDMAMQGRFTAELGYGMDVPWTYGILTPYSGMDLAGSNTTLRLGWRFTLGQALSLSLDGERRKDGRTPPEHVLMLRTSLPW